MILKAQRPEQPTETINKPASYTQNNTHSVGVYSITVSEENNGPGCLKAD